MSDAFDSRQDRILPSPFEKTLNAEAREELDAVLEAVSLLVGTDTGVPITEIEDFATATEALRLAWGVIDDAVTRCDPTAGVDASSLIGLMGRVRRLDISVRDAEARRQKDLVGLVGPALARFQTVESVTQLLDLAPEVICSLGFDRAIVSDIADSHWVTHSSFVVGDDDWAATITRVGKDEPAPLLGPRIPEAEIVRRRTPVVVTDVQGTAHVHRPMAEASLSHSYVAAPLVVRSEVIGLVHGDRYFHRGQTDAFDRDVLAIFAEGLSYAIERSVMQAQLSAMREGLRQLAQDPADPFAGGVRSVYSAAPQPKPEIGAARVSSPTLSADQLMDRLTRRELQIVRHLAQGETNARIASRLVVTEDTVKTHVKHILRKLGASNRAEAVSKWLLANKMG